MAAPTSTAPRYGTVGHLIGGRPCHGAGPTVPIHDPATGELIGETLLGGPAEVAAAVAAAERAWPAWAGMTLRERAQIFFRYRALLEAHRPGLAALITEEHGKLPAEAEAEIDRAIDLSEFASALPQMATGEVLDVGHGIEVRLDRFPVGVMASITPFNFPSMVPHWTIPNALTLGNCLILKPSERVPLSAMRIAALLREAGLPDGVFQVVHGSRDAVTALCDHPGIAGVTFVGSTDTAKSVYRRATGNLKRALALGGAKNHLLVLPDADLEPTAAAVLGSAIGCAGQRCMAGAVMVAVTGTDPVVRRLAELAQAMVPGRDYGPVISAAARDRISAAIAEAIAAGAVPVVDGRGLSVPGREGGFWIGPTILDRVQPEMRIAQEEVFGPVLAIMRVDSLEEGLLLQAQSRYGNAAAIFTRSGGAARAVIARASAGMIGVNVGVPVPREPFPFGGWNESKFGVGDITGRSSIEFWTRAKKTSLRW